MPKQFVNPDAEKLEDKMAPAPSPQKRVSRIAEKFARKPAKTVQRYEKEHSLFSK